MELPLSLFWGQPSAFLELENKKLLEQFSFAPIEFDAQASAFIITSGTILFTIHFIFHSMFL